MLLPQLIDVSALDIALQMDARSELFSSFCVRLTSYVND